MSKDLFDYIKIGLDKITAGKKKEEPIPVDKVPSSEEQVKKVELPDGDETFEEQEMDNLQPKKAWDYIAFQDKVLPVILEKTTNLVAKPSTYPERDLVLLVKEAEKMQVMIDNLFNEAVANYFELRTEHTFKSVTICEAGQQAGMITSDINEFLTIAIRRLNKPKPIQPEEVAPATVKVMGHRCKLKGGDCVLNPEEGKTWNIGWGDFVTINGVARFNQIAWEYTNPEKENINRFLVSRAHAHIKYSRGHYSLIVDVRGTRQAGKVTKVQRGEQIHELNVPGLAYQLQDGDIIHLNAQMMVFDHLKTNPNE